MAEEEQQEDKKDVCIRPRELAHGQKWFSSNVNYGCPTLINMHKL